MLNPRTTLSGYAIVTGMVLLALGYFFGGCTAESVAAGTCEAVNTLPPAVTEFFKMVGLVSAGTGAAAGAFFGKDGGH